MPFREQNGGAMMLRQTKERLKMKANNILLTVAVAAVAAAVNFNARAAEPLLSPRARDNQVRTVPGVTQDRLERGLLPGSPRGRDNQIKVVSGVNNGPSLVVRDQNSAVSPRAAETFPWLARAGAVKSGMPALTKTSSEQ